MTGVWFPEELPNPVVMEKYWEMQIFDKIPPVLVHNPFYCQGSHPDGACFWPACFHSVVALMTFHSRKRDVLPINHSWNCGSNPAAEGPHSFRSQQTFFVPEASLKVEMLVTASVSRRLFISLIYLDVASTFSPDSLPHLIPGFNPRGWGICPLTVTLFPFLFSVFLPPLRPSLS